MGQIKSASFTQALTAAALSESFSLATGRKCKISQVLFRASVNITETFKLTHNSKFGSTYDTVLVETDITAAKDYVFRPTGDCWLDKGDALDLDCTDANSLGIVYVTVQYEEVL